MDFVTGKSGDGRTNWKLHSCIEMLTGIKCKMLNDV